MEILNIRSTLILTIIVVTMLTSCAVTEQYKNYFKETSEIYEQTKDLNANIDTTGLILIDAVSSKTGNKLSLIGVEIFDTQSPDNSILRASFNSGFLMTNTGVVVIKDIQPGTYRINKLKFWNVNLTEIVYVPKTSEYEVKVIARKPTYFGQINVRQSFGSADREYEIKYDKVGEVEAWKKVLSKYEKSSWAKTIQAYLNGLQ